MILLRCSPHLPGRSVTGYTLLKSCLLLFCCASPIASQTSVLQGVVTDAGTGAPLEGANVILDQDGTQAAATFTNRDGFYVIGGIEPGTYTLQVSYLGHAPFEETLVLEAGNRTRSVALDVSPVQLEGVLVTQSAGAARREVGRQQITPGLISIAPTPAGSGDLATYLQTVPGVVTLGDRGGQIFVRGGTHTENLALVDGLLIYQPFHILGFFSAFPEDLVATVDFYAGGFGARYNGRTSSVMDVRLRDGNRTDYAATGSLSPFLADVLVEGPVNHDSTVSILASFRRSVLEETSPTLLGQTQPIGFNSQFLKLTSFDDDGSSCSGLLLRTADEGRMDPEDEVSRVGWENLVAGARCTHLFEGSLRMTEVNVGYSSVKNEAVSRGASQLFSDTRRFQLEVNSTTLLDNGVPLEAGAYGRLEEMEYDLGEFLGTQRGESYLWSAGGFAEVAIPVGDRGLIQPGVVMTLEGPFGLEPRLRGSWQPFGSDDQEITFAVGYYRQEVAGISDTRDANSVFVAWNRVEEGRPMGSIHAQLGWQQTLLPGLDWSIEVYHRNISDVSVPVWSTEARFNTELALADGTVWGADARVEYNRPGIYGFLGYGYSRTEYVAAQDRFSVWFGEPIQRYNPPHDRRHQLNAMIAAEVGGFDLGARWQFGTGLPFTRPMGYDETFDFRVVIPRLPQNAGRTRLVVDRPYGARLPLTHRLDVSIEREFELPIATLRTQLGAINAYDRTNIFYYDIYTHRRLDQLPFAPYASIRLEVQ